MILCKIYFVHVILHILEFYNLKLKDSTYYRIVIRFKIPLKFVQYNRDSCASLRY